MSKSYRQVGQERVPEKGPSQNTPAEPFHAPVAQENPAENDHEIVDERHQSRDEELLSEIKDGRDA